jgi:hypothetical protein
MPVILIVDKSGSIKELNVKTYSEDELYKKAGFKTSEGFKLITTWDVNLEGTKYFISVYGKTTGRAGQENKYEFPPTIDNVLLFGNCVLVNQLECEPVSNLKKSEWDRIYEHLYGGFEDIADESSDLSHDDTDSDLNLPITASGYVKDGFIVDDDDLDVENDSEEDERLVITTKTKNKDTSKPHKKLEKKGKSEKRIKKTTVFEKIDTSISPPETSNFLDCSSELEEEEYL